MKKLLYSGILLSSLAAAVFQGCKKKEDAVPPTTKQSDQSGSSAADGAIDDANDFISNGLGGGSNHQRTAAYNLPCGSVRIDSSSTSGSNKIYKINYGVKTPCGYKMKSGEVAVTLVSGQRFSDQNAMFKITFSNYVIEIAATNDIVTLNGALFVTNLTGGHIWQAVTNNDTISHRIRGSFTTLYANGTARIRNYYQIRTWSSTSSWKGLTFTVAGDTSHTIPGPTNVSEIGKTYDGNYDYYTQILTPFKWVNCTQSTSNEYAGPYTLVQGDAKLNVTSALISPAFFEITGGYNYNINNLSATPTPTNDCSSNAYKINVTLGTSTTTQYQFY